MFVNMKNISHSERPSHMKQSNFESCFEKKKKKPCKWLKFVEDNAFEEGI